jgi:CheY-like chemotaxis protein
MSKVLIIEKDNEVVSSIERLLHVFNLDAEAVLSHPNAIQSYTSDDLKAIIIDSEMPTISTNRLVAEFDDIAARKNKPRCPIIFLYKVEETPRQLQLNQIPRSVYVRKPVSMIELYRILETLKLSSLFNDAEGLVEDRLDRYMQFLDKSSNWMKRLNENLNRNE